MSHNRNSPKQIAEYAEKLATLAYYSASRTVKELSELTGMSETAVRRALSKHLKVKPKPGNKGKITQWHLVMAERRKAIYEDTKSMETIDVAIKYNLTQDRVRQIKKVSQ